MQINNPFQMNDWEIRKFLKAILAIQLILWGVIGLDALGLQIPILRQLIGFFYLTFVPGIIILRILKLHKLGNIETLLYTVGLSIATLMFTGLFMNTVYPFFGISGPFSIIPLIITISILVLILCIASYVRDKDFVDSKSYIDIKDVLSPPALFLCLVPFLAVFGTYLVNFYHNNILLLFLIVIIALIALLIGFNRFIPKILYPLAVFVIAISLLFHRSLISMYLTGWDIYTEYHFSNLVLTNFLWDFTIPGNVNAMLSITMLAPIFSSICDMCLTWVFKIIYPLLYSLVPLGLYRAFQKQTDDKIAFLSCFFFTSGYIFYTEMLQLARQQIAELFLVLLILSMVDRDMNKMKRSFLFIVFGISMVVSHYGLSYFCMFCFIMIWIILVLIDNPEIQKLRNNFHSKNRRFTNNPISSNATSGAITLCFVLLFVVFAVSWYMHLSSSSTFNSLVYLGDHITSTINEDFLEPEAVQGLRLMTAQPQPGLLHEVNRITNYLNQIFIIIGCIVLLLKYKELKFEREYATFSVLNLGILFASISISGFAALNMTRTYHIALIFLAPFCVIGGVTVFRALSRIVGVTWTNKTVKSSLKVLSVYFVIFLLFSSGFIYEVAEGHSNSISLGHEGVKKYGDARVKASFYSGPGYFMEQDIFGKKWISKNRDVKSGFYADFRHGGGLLTSTTRVVRESSYIYLGYTNIHYGVIHHRAYYGNITDISPLLGDSSRIYSNGGAEVFYYR